MCKSMGGLGAAQAVHMVKNPSLSAGDIRDVGSVPGSGRSPGGGHGNPLQYYCLENPMERGAWWTAGHGIAESGTAEVTKYTHVSSLLALIYCESSF